MQANELINQLQNHVESASGLAKTWFESNSGSIPEGELARSKMGDLGTGAVYVYFDAKGLAIYIGQTGRHIKARLYDQTSPHKNKKWWTDWTYMRFVQMPDPMDRLILEFLLILSFSPTENRSPKSKNVRELFKTG